MCMPLMQQKVIYLDQNAWSNLLKSSEETVGFFEDLSDSGKVIFPLSIVHLQETTKICNNTKRLQIAKLMVGLSKQYSFLPYVDQIIEMEVRNEILRLYGCQPVNLDSYVLNKGICHLLGVKPTIVKRPGANVNGEPPSDVKKKMMDYIESPDAMLDAFLLLPTLKGKTKSSYEETVMKMEQNRKNLLKIADKNFRRKFVFADFMIDFIGPTVAKMLAEINMPKAQVFFKNWDKKDFETFIDHIPTAFSLFSLIFKRDQQLQRLIEVNDIPDVWALSLAIPYSDIVVTEKMWASIAMQETKLASKCNAKVLTTIEELLTVLKQEE